MAFMSRIGRAFVQCGRGNFARPQISLLGPRPKYLMIKFCSSSASAVSGSVHVFHRQGLPVLSVPLPSRQEQCQFTMKPFGHNLGDFFTHLQEEDHGIDRVSAYDTDGTRIAQSTPISVLLLNDFELLINEHRYHVNASPVVDTDHDNLQLSDIRRQISELHAVLNVDEYQLQRERELLLKMEEIQTEIEPLEAVKKQLEDQARGRTNRLAWVGLGLMGLQFGILARLTWWEYSWDIMEPVTYFITYGTSIAMFAYYVVTKQDYNFSDVRDRQFLLSMYKSGKKVQMDFDRYNRLREDLYEVRYDLERLRDPLQLQLPVRQIEKRRAEDADPQTQ